MNNKEIKINKKNETMNKLKINNEYWKICQWSQMKPKQSELVQNY